MDSEERPWGSWHVIDEGDGYKVKRIHVNARAAVVLPDPRAPLRALGRHLRYGDLRRRRRDGRRGTGPLGRRRPGRGPPDHEHARRGARDHRGPARRLHRRGRHLPARGRLRAQRTPLPDARRRQFAACSAGAERARTGRTLPTADVRRWARTLAAPADDIGQRCAYESCRCITSVPGEPDDDEAASGALGVAARRHGGTRHETPWNSNDSASITMPSRAVHQVDPADSVDLDLGTAHSPSTKLQQPSQHATSNGLAARPSASVTTRMGLLRGRSSASDDAAANSWLARHLALAQGRVGARRARWPRRTARAQAMTVGRLDASTWPERSSRRIEVLPVQLEVAGRDA